MALADIMSVEVGAKYDSSSSSSASSDSDDASSSPSSSSDDGGGGASSSSSSSASASSAASAKLRAKAKAKVKRKPPPPPPPVDAPPARRPPPPKKKKAPLAKARVAPPPPPPPPVLPPPPPPPALLAAAIAAARSSSSSDDDDDSSDSSSSSESDSSGDTSEVEAAKRKLEALKQAVEASVAANAAAARRNSAATNPDALRVTLKLPPGFVPAAGNGAAAKAKRAAAPTPTAKRQRTASTTPTNRKKPAAAGAAKAPATAAKPTAKPRQTPTASAAAAAAKKTAAVTALPPSSTQVFPQAPVVLPKLIPKGPTVPQTEVRGSRELSLIGSELASSRPEEVLEKEIPAEFNDPYAVEADTLRNLDLFFFCDEKGNPISLEILDRPKEQRPRIMGFGTVVQHLPPEERPLPVKYILPSPAFPSRSRKRPRSDKIASSQRREESASRSKKKVKVSEEGESLFQGDGAFGGDDECCSSPQRSSVGSSIFQSRSTVRYASRRGGAGRRASQLDGQSDSESGSSGMTSDDDDGPRSQQSGAQSDHDSELLSTASSSSSDSESGNEGGSNSSSSGSGSDDETGPDTDDARPKASSSSAKPSKKKKKKVSNPVQGARASNGIHGHIDVRPRRRSKPKATSSNPVVNELMRTDDNFPLEPEGTEDELNLMECSFRHPTEYKRMRVWLPEITDWCLDYSEGDPTLWVITPHAWYKIAGPLSGLLPHAYYRETFKHVRMLFESSYLVAYVLKEWLPINKKVAYRATLEQICELSLKGRYRVTGWFLMENYHFILSQICNLFPDKDTYVESMFFRQLHRLSDNHKSREARVRKELARREVRRVEREKERAERDKERSERKDRIEDERKKWKNQRDEDKMLKEEEQKYPIEDLELLAEHEAATVKVPLEIASLEGVTGDLLGELIMAWQTICTFKNFVTLEPISLEALVHRMTTKCKDGTDMGLAQIFLAFLRKILAEKSFTSLMDDIVVEGNIKVSDLFVNSERTYGICERQYNDMLNIVTWQDILRQLMSKDLGIDSSIGHVEPLVGCEIVRQTLYMQTVSAPFNAPVDTTQKGLEDYMQVVKQPMDLGTIKQKLDSGGYEGDGGYERFASDVRLVWENALAYNGEESEIGRAAIALSDIFEQDYSRFVVGRIQANDQRVEGCKKAKRDMLDRVDRHTQFSANYVDIVHALYSFEYHELPVSYKIGALSWLCSEFLKLDSIRTFIEAQVEKEITLVREHRKRAADIESRRRIAERVRREKESTFRKDCISRGILPNAQSTLSEAMRQQHEFIGKFYDEVYSVNEDGIYEDDKKNHVIEMENELRAIIIRDEPLGRDRFHNRYWTFKNDAQRRVFIEKCDTGEFAICRSEEDLSAIMRWLNPKGIREAELLSKLEAVKDRLFRKLSEASESGLTQTTGGRAKGEIKVNLFPLPGGFVKPELVSVKDDDDRLSSHEIVAKMLLSLQNHVAQAGILEEKWDASTSWGVRVKEAATFDAERALFLQLEDAVVTSAAGNETVRLSWQRKRREWRLALEGACTYAQLVFLLHLLLDECVNVDAFMDQYARLDRKDWFKLRAKESRNFIPEAGREVVYFGDGHAQALKEDAKAKKKRFAKKSDPPHARATLVCDVQSISYHHGGGDPYALVLLTPKTDLTACSFVRAPGALLCPQPSPLQRLSRILMRLLGKLKLQSDAGPFLEPVSDRDFPEYKEIVLRPMNFLAMTNKVKALEYRDAAQFLADVKLICSNCELFCEGRFPALPPLARNLVELADGLVKRAMKEIRPCEKLISDVNAVATPSPEKPARPVGNESEDGGSGESKESAVDAAKSITAILRLENRLPEYVVDVKRYEAAVSRTWASGEKFRMLFRDPRGFPGEYYGGVAAGSLPFAANGLLPWEALRVTWDEDDGSDDSRINPWEAELVHQSKK